MSAIKTVDDFTAQQLNAMPKSARPISFRPLNPESINKKYSDRRRTGKTAKDHKRRHKNVPD